MLAAFHTLQLISGQPRGLGRHGRRCLWHGGDGGFGRIGRIGHRLGWLRREWRREGGIRCVQIGIALPELHSIRIRRELLSQGSNLRLHRLS